MNAEEIREGVRNQGHLLTQEKMWLVHDAALEYAKSLDDPIFYCFVHGVQVDIMGRGWASSTYCLVEGEWGNLDPGNCDVALATRPQRIDQS